MASVVKKIKRKRNNFQEFQITASVNALTLECRKDVWVPEKLVILWNKEDGNSHTKPVPWQPGVNNPFRGIHVWPEEDPVKFISTLHKNIKREGTYEDHPWEVIIKNETKKGNRKTIAFGLLDLSDYISKEERTVEITVTLRPVNKNIISGSAEFKLTSVLLEDGVPYRNRDEELREILEGAVKANSANKRAARKAKSVSQGNLSAGDKTQTSRTVPAQEQSKAKEKGLQAGAVSKPVTDVIRKGGVRKDERRKAPPPPIPPPPPPPPRPHTIPGLASAAVEKKCGSGELNSLPVQGSSEEPPSKTSKTSSPPSRKGKKKKNKTEYPRELNPFPGSSSEDERSLSSEDVLLSKEKTAKDTTGAAKKEDGEENLSQNGAPSSPQGHNKRQGKKELAKYPKALNPFVSSSDDESVESPSKEAGMAQHSSASTDQLKKEKQKVSDTEAPTSSKGQKKTRGRKKRDKYPKVLNPFGGSSDEEVGTLSPKAAGMKKSSSSSEELTGDNEKVSDTEDPRLKPNRQKPSPSFLVAEKKEELKPISTEACDGEEKIPDMGHMKSGAAQMKKEKPLTIEKPVQASDSCEISETKPEEVADCDAVGAAEKPSKGEKAGKTFVSCDTTPTKPEKAVNADQCITGGTVGGASDQAASGDNERPAFTDAVSPEFQDDMAEPEAQAVREQSCQVRSDAATGCDAVGAVSSAHGDVSSGVETRPLLQQATISLDAPNPVEVPVSVECYPHDDNVDVHCLKSETVPVRQDDGSAGDKDLSSSEVAPRQDVPVLKELGGAHFNAVTPPRKVPTPRKKAPPKPGRPMLLRRRAALTSDKALRNRLELSAYVMEELYPLNKEINSLRNVIFKVELELQEAKKTDCKEEYDGLMQDWLILNNHRAELTARKQNLQTLEKSEDLVLCCDIMRSELKLFFEVEDWRKTDHLRYQEASLLNLLVSFETQRREIC